MKATELLHKNPIYNATYEQMIALQLSYLGGYQFKQYVRKKRPSEDSNLWQDLIANTVAQPVCRYIVETINDVLFEPGVKRNVTFATPQGAYINPDNTEWAELFLLDADLSNRSLDAFMENVGDLTSIYGHCWVAVDMPQEGEGNLGRPYVVSINPLDVWDWKWEFFGGKPMVKYVKIKEAEDKDNWYIKCYHLGTEDYPSYWKSYKIGKDIAKNDVEEIGKGTYPPGMALPIFIAYGRRDPRTIDVGVSDIDSAADAQREHYKLECEAYTSIQFAKTIIRADQGVKIPVHAGAIVRASQGQVEAIAVDLQDIDKIIAKQQNILEQIEALTGLGGLRNTKNQIASGVAIIEERKQLHRLAKSKARLMEITEEMIFTFAARFMNMRWAGEVHYNTDYEAHDTNYRIAVMAKAKELVPTNSIIDSLIIKEVIGMLAPSENISQYEQLYIDTIEDPQVKALMTKNNQQVLSRDLGNQIPTPEQFGETEEIEGDDIAGEGPDGDDGEYGDDYGDYNSGVGTPITMTGQSYYTDQAIVAQLVGTNTGR
jgi:hypothetical protein